MTPQEQEIVNLKSEVAVLTERIRASDKAQDLASESLTAYKASSNEWRQALNDQRSLFCTRHEVITIVTVGLTVLGIVLKFMK
jgi:hypothetical protein